MSLKFAQFRRSRPVAGAGLARLTRGLRRAEASRRLRADAAVAGSAAAVAVAGTAIIGWAVGVAVPALAVGFVVAGVAFLVRLTRPRRGEVELLADLDRRLGLHELLSTAHALDPDDDRPTAIAVRAAAEARAAQIDLAAVAEPTRGPGLLTAGLALAASVALAMTLAPTAPTRSDEAADRASAVAARAMASTDGPRWDDDRGDRRAADAESPGAQRRGTTSTDVAGRESDGTCEDGRGRSPGATAARVPTMPAGATAPVAEAGDDRALGRGATIARGEGATDPTATADRATLASSATSDPGSPPDLAAAARRAIDDGRLPARSRDLVRAYFGLADEGRSTR